MGTKTIIIIIIGVVDIVVAVVLCLASGGRYVRSQHQFKQWRATGKGMLPDYDKHNCDIDKYSR